MIRAVEHATVHDRLRFQIETEAVARLQHPHIVPLYEVGEVGGRPFFSLEFCDGGTLADHLKKQRPTPRESAQLIETLARAMHYAHLRGVVHRDLKPGNVLLAGAEKAPKITDFGLAKRIDDEARDVSKSGAVMGTAAYMAPEQAAGRVRDTGPAADVYALGALLYECLTGRPPFDGPQHVVLARVMSEEPPPPSRLAPKLPRDLETICLKCLSKEPARRYASAEELADDLRRFRADEPIRARPVGAAERAVKWVRRHAVVSALAAAVLLATVLGAAGIVWKYLDAEQQKAFAQKKEEEARQEAEKARKVRDFLVSIFKRSNPRTQGGLMSTRQILDDAEKRIPTEFADQPELQIELQAAIDRVYAEITRDAPLAMILEVGGVVKLQSPRNADQRAVPQALLYAGDRLSVGRDAEVRLVVLSDLHQEWLRSGREAAVRRKGCDPADAVEKRSDDLMMTFVRLPRATFYMGWGGYDAKGKLLTNGTKTEISEDFEIAVHDVTQAQWQAIMDDNPSSFSHFGTSRLKVTDISDEELKLFPVEQVSWDDAQEFIRKLNEKERGRGYLYRLPTEAEWEYACRGGATSEEECSYHFYFDQPTNDLSSERANFNGNYPGGNAPKGKYLARTTRVGAYPSNKLGLCDMQGNVAQWCADAVGTMRALRGGPWLGYAKDCQATSRAAIGPDGRDYLLGFRLVRVPVR